MQLQALLAFFRHKLHKKHGGIDILENMLLEFKVVHNSHCNPTQDVMPWTLVSSKKEGRTNWNNTVKYNARDHKIF